VTQRPLAGPDARRGVSTGVQCTGGDDKWMRGCPRVSSVHLDTGGTTKTSQPRCRFPSKQLKTLGAAGGCRLLGAGELFRRLDLDGR
jgi:hypothetical protein